MASSKKPKGRKRRTATNAWRHLMTSLYPDLQTSTICVPPVIINRVAFSRDTVAGQPVLVLQKRDDGQNTHTSIPMSTPGPVEDYLRRILRPLREKFMESDIVTFAFSGFDTSTHSALQSQPQNRSPTQSASMNEQTTQNQPHNQSTAQNQPHNQSTAQNQPQNQPTTHNQPTTQNQPHNQSTAHNQPHNQPTAQNQPHSQSTAQNQPQNQPTTQNQPHNQSTAQNQPHNQPGSQNQLHNQPGSQNKPQNQPTTQNQPHSQPTAQNQSHNQPTTQNQPHNQPGSQNQPHNQPTAQNQPHNQPTAQNQPHNQPTAHNQPTTQNQPHNQPTAQNQSHNQPTTQNQPHNQPGSQNQPHNQPTAQNQPHNQPTAQNQPHNQPGSQNQPHNQPTAQNQPHNQPTTQSQPKNPHGHMWLPDPSPQTQPKHVIQSDARDDFSQQYLLTSLQHLGDSRGEVMFIVSQLNFTSYLRQPSYAAAAKTLPRPGDLGKAYEEGDFDILLIHRHYGILIGEIKSVGMVHGELNRTQSQTDDDVAKRVWRAIKQLDKSETVVKHLVHDIAPGLMVRKTVILPFVDSGQLLRILTSDKTLGQAVCACLGAASETDAIKLCVCSDQLSDCATYWKVTRHDLSNLTTWWNDRMACSVDNTLTDLIYLDLVARFAGPATTMTIQSSVPPRLQIPTLGDAVSYVGDSLARLVLTPQQTDLLHRAPSRVYIKGPPGTGKTLMLVLMGLQWLLQGHDVYVLCYGIENLAVSELIYHQLQASAALHAPQSATPVGTAHLLGPPSYGLVTCFAEMLNMITELHTKGGTKHIVIDEYRLGKGISAPSTTWEVNYPMWILEKLFKDQCVWVAGITNIEKLPSFEEVFLTTPLRCAPPVQREIQPGIDDWAKSGKMQPYSGAGIASPSDGLHVIRLTHQSPDHTTRWPVDCQTCGRNIADVLHQLNVGGKGNAHTQSRPAPLQYRDVFVVTRSSQLQNDVIDDSGNVVGAASGVVLGLRAAGIPVCVLGSSASADYMSRRSDFTDVALAQSDHVTVSFSMFVQGLERKVVVWLPGENKGIAEDEALSSSQTADRIHAVSRCTTQLVVVDIPQLVDSELD